MDPDPDQLPETRRLPFMLKKLIVTLIASAFALTAFAQAPKSDTTSPAATKSEKMDKKAAKGEKKAKSKGEKKSKSKGKAKTDDAKAPKAKSDEDKKDGSRQDRSPAAAGLFFALQFSHVAPSAAVRARRARGCAGHDLARAIHHHARRRGGAHARARRHGPAGFRRRPGLGRWPHRHHGRAQVRRARTGNRTRRQARPGRARKRPARSGARARAVRAGRRAADRLFAGERGHGVPPSRAHRAAANPFRRSAEARHAHRVARVPHGRLAAGPLHDDEGHEAAPRARRREHALPLDRAGERARDVEHRRPAGAHRPGLPAAGGRGRD